jgi:hypothetical protein
LWFLSGNLIGFATGSFAASVGAPASRTCSSLSRCEHLRPNSHAKTRTPERCERECGSLGCSPYHGRSSESGRESLPIEALQTRRLKQILRS